VRGQGGEGSVAAAPKKDSKDNKGGKDGKHRPSPLATASFLLPAPRLAAQAPVRRAALPRSAAAYAELIREAAVRHSLSPALIEAVARVESGFNPRAVSHKGARGLMQVMPATGRRFGVRSDRLLTPEHNIAAGTAYLAWLSKRYRGNLDLVLAAYNAGEGAVDDHGGIPPYRETRNYVRRVRAALRSIEEKALSARQLREATGPSVDLPLQEADQGTEAQEGVKIKLAEQVPEGGQS
jgi:membrane-bound lytic murein transglycosylase MltF